MNQILLWLGLNTSGFKAGLKSVQDDTKALNTEWKGLKNIMNIAAPALAVIGFFRSMIEHAREATAAVDENTQAVRNLGDGWDYLSGKAKDFGVQAVGLLGRAGENIVDMARYAYLGAEAFEAEAAAVRESQQGVDEMTRNQIEANAARAEFLRITEKLKANEEKRAEIAVKALSTEKEADARWLKVSQIQADILSLQREGLSITQYNLQLRRLQLALSDAQLAADAAEVALAKEKAEVAAKTVKTKAVAVVVTEEEHKKNIPLTDEMRAQQDILEAKNVAQAMQNLLLQDELIIQGKIYGASRDIRDIQGASDAELRELIRRQKEEIRKIEDSKVWGPTAGVDAVSGFIVQEAAIARLQTDIQRAQYQLDERDKGRQDYAFGGVNLARSRYTGDPLQFDEYIDKITRAQDSTDRTNELLGDLVSEFRGQKPQPNIADKIDKLTSATQAVATVLNTRGIPTG